MNEEVSFVDAEEYLGEDKSLTFKDLVLKHLNKVSDICIKEFREGYWQKKPVVIGSGAYMSETYVEDMRDAYINSVDFLYDILLPYFDDDMNKESEKINNELKEKLEYNKAAEKKKTEWLDEKLEIKRRTFQQLSLLLFRLGYLKAKKLEE